MTISGLARQAYVGSLNAPLLHVIDLASGRVVGVEDEGPVPPLPQLALVRAIAGHDGPDGNHQLRTE